MKGFLFIFDKVHGGEFLLLERLITEDFSACSKWLSEDWQSHGLGLTPNFGLTGYKTYYLLYYVGEKRLD